MSAAIPQPSAYSNFVTELKNALQKITDTYLDEFNEHLAFNYLIADTFETTNKEHFVLSDGSRDGGIDFFVRYPRSYSIFQCKCPTLESLDNASTPPKYDKGTVNELIAAVRFLTDKNGMPDYKSEVLRLRTDYHRELSDESEVTRLTATLAIAGELTPAAQDLFSAEKRRLSESTPGLELNLKTWRDIFEALHQEVTTEDFSIYLRYEDYEKDLLRGDKYFFMLAKATDLYKAWCDHGLNLFDWNVRMQVPSSQSIVIV